jgi:hypothetical protein
VLTADLVAEVARLAGEALTLLDPAAGPEGLARLEAAVRAAVLRVGAGLLEGLLAADRGHRGADVDCGQGHQAAFVGYRPKHVDTVLGPLTLERAWYHCADCHRGHARRDVELGVAGASLSPGLRRMVARAAANRPFAQARRDLAEFAGVELTTKRIERSAEADGQALAAAADAEADAILADALAPLAPTAPVATLYLAMDGTGVPTVPADTHGRRGKHPDGRARTREVKLACLFTQTDVDDQGRPLRDPDSSSYIGTFQPAERFGTLVYAEARRRGVDRAQRLVVLGDGAPWIWNLADEHFPGAIQIVDRFHAKQKLSEVAKSIYGPASDLGREWARERHNDLDAGHIEAVLCALRVHSPKDDEARKCVDYIQRNRQRMRYAQFQAAGLCTSTGVVEAGCKVAIGTRCKRAGMHWTLAGADAIIALRCCKLSGRFEGFWKRRSATRMAAA